MKLHRVTGTTDIQRPLSEVFGLYLDFPTRSCVANPLPALQKQKPRSAKEAPLGSCVHVPMKVTELHKDRLIRYRSCNRRSSSARWQVLFRPLGPSMTRVDEELVLPFGMLGRWTS